MRIVHTDLYHALYAFSERCLASANVEEVVVSCASRDGMVVMVNLAFEFERFELV